MCLEEWNTPKMELNAVHVNRFEGGGGKANAVFVLLTSFLLTNCDNWAAKQLEI